MGAIKNIFSTNMFLAVVFMISITSGCGTFKLRSDQEKVVKPIRRNRYYNPAKDKNRKRTRVFYHRK